MRAAALLHGQALNGSRLSGCLKWPNGLPLTKIHHAAFDAYLIGIDPDFRIHVSDRLLETHNGPFLAAA
jgi:predicted restriction endonuclease